MTGKGTRALTRESHDFSDGQWSGDGEAMGVEPLPALPGKARGSIGAGALAAQLARDYESVDTSVGRAKLEKRYPLRYLVRVGGRPKDGFVMLPVESGPNPWWQSLNWIKDRGMTVPAPTQYVIVGNKVEMSTTCFKGNRETVRTLECEIYRFQKDQGKGKQGNLYN